MTQKPDYKTIKANEFTAHITNLWTENQNLISPDIFEITFNARAAQIRSMKWTKEQLISRLALVELGSEIMAKQLGKVTATFHDFKKIDDLSRKAGGNTKGEREPFKTRRNFALDIRSELIKTTSETPTPTQWLNEITERIKEMRKSKLQVDIETLKHLDSLNSKSKPFVYTEVTLKGYLRNL